LVGLSVVVLIFSAARVGDRTPTVSDGSTLILNLRGSVPEKAPVSIPIPFIGGSTPLTVPEIWSTLHRAAGDSRIKALVLEIGRTDAGWAKLNEIRDDVLAFRKSGKPVYAFLKGPRTREYYVATAADRIYTEPEDLVDVKGLRAELMYFKNTLDKLGVQVEVEHVGRFKDAGDSFTQTSMSPETRESLGLVVDGIYNHVIQALATGRKKTPDEIRAIVDDGPYTAKQAAAKGLIDSLRYEDQVYGELKAQLKQTSLVKLNFRNYVKAIGPDTTASKKIALVVGEGTILRGAGDDAMGSDEGFTSGAFIKMLRSVGSDSSISGVILRVDSPGGDAFASDEILREVRLLRDKKPMVISMSDAAASGGYYVAMTGDPVLAYPTTLTGSIGVLFTKINLRGLYDKLGIQKDFLLRGKNSNIDSDYGPMTPEARAKLQAGIQEFYTQFVTKVSEGRKRKYEDVEPLAQGRVWLGSDAKERGLVDELGGLDAAVAAIRKKAGMKEGEGVRLVPYPPKRTLLDQLLKSNSESASVETKLIQTLGFDYRVWAQSGFLRMLPFQITIQ
ncbi:MAG: signal peptide peptidase SppA, partial [Bryobacteraceae bacterium]|nr:signal peptide peptidase SppA [Bryobacteraceae bacterium]